MQGFEIPAMAEPDQAEMADQLADFVLSFPADYQTLVLADAVAQYRRLLTRDFPSLTDEQLDTNALNLKRAILSRMLKVLLSSAETDGTA